MRYCKNNNIIRLLFSLFSYYDSKMYIFYNLISHTINCMLRNRLFKKKSSFNRPLLLFSFLSLLFARACKCWHSTKPNLIPPIHHSSATVIWLIATLYCQLLCISPSKASNFFLHPNNVYTSTHNLVRHSFVYMFLLFLP